MGSYFQWNSFFNCRKYFIQIILILGLVLTLLGCNSDVQSNEKRPLRVGLLFSLTGPLSPYEKPVMEAIILAIEDINEKGGVHGQQIEYEIIDGRSDPEFFYKALDNTIQKKAIRTFFGGSYSYIRKGLVPLLENNEALLLYPYSYEGMEESKNVVYVGSVPNQQIIPAISWAFKNIGKKFYIIGAEEIYSKVVAMIIKDYVYALNGEVVGEGYILLDNNKEFDPVFDDVIEKKPDVIVNLLTGSMNVEYFQLLRLSGIYSKDIPTIGFGLNELILRQLNSVDMEGDYSVWSYYQNIKNTVNQEFVGSFQRKYGKGRAIDDAMEAGYSSVHLWVNAVKETSEGKVHEIFESIQSQSFMAPSGIVYIDGKTNHAFKHVRIGKIQSDGKFKIVWDSGGSVVPFPYTLFRNQTEWNSLVSNFYDQWGQNWYKRLEI